MGATMTGQEYASFNILVTRCQTQDFPLQGGTCHAKATEYLDGLTPFKAYLQQLEHPEPTDNTQSRSDSDAEHLESDMKCFRGPHKQQTKLLQQVNKPCPERTRMNCKCVVINIALVQFLDSLCFGLPDSIVNWSWRQTQYKNVKFHQCSLSTTVDGRLVSSNYPDELFAITETEITLHRPCKTPEIRHREAAQVLCWIASDLLPSRRRKSNIENDRRMLISQDQDRLFITLAAISPEYLEFLRKPNAPGASLNMFEYGPFFISSANDMYAFAKIVVTHCLAVSEQNQGLA